ncbi:MAG: TerB family tellurite resistance protein [Deltaproteobacteria bacterium]|nr:TerB family tellurite resistance protein [Deltaproteobacteria bacterium]
MFGKLKSFFKGEATLEKTLQADRSGQPTAQDLHIAALVLLIEMAGTDQGIAPQEAQAVCALMQKEFALAEESLPELVQLAVAARQEKGKIDEFVVAINANFDETQRQRLLAMIWKIVLADGKVDKFEQRFAVQMYNRFRLTEDQAATARSMAEKGKI